MRHAIALLLSACSISAPAAVPLRWTVETSRAQPATFDEFAGATYGLEATLQSYGRPLEVVGDPHLYWQTNGMGSAYWSAPATVSGNVLRATWTPSCDVGARVYNCFIGITGTVYNAAFQLRLRPSPGAVPNELPIPTPVIDFSKVTVLNPPWPSGVDTNAVLALVADKRDKTDLAVHATLTNVAPFGIDYWFVNDNRLSLAYTDDGFAAWSGFGFAITATQSDGTLKFHYGDPGEGSVDFNFLEGDLVIYYEPIDTYLTNHVKAVMKRIDTIALVSQLAPVATNAADALSAANEANAWSSATYAFMTGGRTNCWWSGTNYVFGADAATRTRFAWEPGMDAATVPCSMALYEIREGVRECVWDQRDWTAWYWSFKAQQMETAIQGRIDALGNAVTNDAMYAWAKHYASDGVRNPDPSTTYIDTSTVTLSPGMRWETVATVSGASYWTIVGDGAVIGGSGTNATLQIRDFEGNEIMTVTKGEHRLAWLEHGEIVGNMTDAQGRVCFDMLADAQPTGYFSTTLDHDDFVAETSDDCPASYEWEDIGGGKWRVHFTLKPGIQANSCFAKFMVEIEGQTIIRYNAGQEIQGGLIYNGVKIAPDVSGSPAVGTVIQWKVVH